MKNNLYENIPILNFKEILKIKLKKDKEIYLKKFLKVKNKFVIIDFENQSYTIQILNEIFNLLFDLQKKKSFILRNIQEQDYQYILMLNTFWEIQNRK
jgi:hypothetical protein